jgi:nucleoid DNA-binding protein
MAENKTAKADKPMTKSAVYQQLAESTKLTRKQVSEVFDALTALIKRELGKKGPGVFTLPGLLKLRLVRKPATKAKKGRNPFTGEEMMFKAKPARNAVRPRALKTLNEMIK